MWMACTRMHIGFGIKCPDIGGLSWLTNIVTL